MEMKEVEYTQYKEFLCAKDAEEWAHTHYSDVLALPKDSFAYQSVLYYAGSMSRKWNRTLRRCPSIESGDFEKYASSDYASDGEHIGRIKEATSQALIKIRCTISCTRSEYNLFFVNIK